MGLYDPKDIELLIVKDPDVITTTDIVRKNIFAPATNARFMIFTTVTPSQKCLENLKLEAFYEQPPVIAPNIQHSFLECLNFADNLLIVKKILGAIDGQVIVFCQVSILAIRNFAPKHCFISCTLYFTEKQIGSVFGILFGLCGFCRW